MGNRPSARLAWGICLKMNPDDPDVGYEYMEKIDEVFPRWRAGQKQDPPLRTVVGGYCEEPDYFLVVTKSVVETPDWGCVEIKELAGEGPLRETWEAHLADVPHHEDVDLTQTPCWHLISYYG